MKVDLFIFIHAGFDRKQFIAKILMQRRSSTLVQSSLVAAGLNIEPGIER